MLQALLGVGRPDARRRRRSSSTRTSARAPRSQQGAVDAATGFAQQRAGPARARRARRRSVLTVDAITPLPGPGSSSGQRRSTPSRTRSRRSSAATLRAMDEIGATRRSGSTRRSRPCRSWPRTRDAQAAILAATIATWAGPVQDGHRLGAIDRDGLEQVDRLHAHARAGHEPGDDRRRRARGSPAAAGLGPGAAAAMLAC